MKELEQTPGTGEGDWLDQEPSMRSIMIAELKRFKGRMKARPARVLVLAGLCTALALARYATRPRLYTARVLLSATQGWLNDEDGSPLPNQEIRDHVYNYILNKKVLIEEVIEKHGIHRDTMKKFGEEAAIAEIKDPLAIHVFRNYFLFSQRQESTPRSMRMVVSYTSTDPEFAYEMASLIASLVVENVQSQRLREARFAARNASEASARLLREAASRKAALGELMFELTRAERARDARALAETRVAIAELGAALEDSETQRSMVQSEARDIEFRLRAEERNMALLWSVAGAFRPRAMGRPGPIRLTAIGIVCFCLFVPICAIGLGAFDSKVRDLHDVRRLGLPVLGHIPAFRGDHVGSLEARGVSMGRRAARGRRARRRLAGNRRI